MATTFKWLTPESIVTVFTTALNSLGDGSASAASSNLANGTDLYEYAAFELVLASLSPAAGAYVQLLSLYTIDGSNYADAKPLQTTAVLANIPLDTAATTAQRIAAGPYPIMPFDFEVVLINHAGVALAASGNTLKMRRFYEQSV